MRKNKFIALILLTICALFMIVPTSVDAETYVRTLTPTDTSGNYTQSDSGFFVVSGTPSAGYASANYTVGDTTYVNNFANAAGSTISFNIPAGLYAGRVGKLEIVALANSTTDATCSLRVRDASSTVILSQSVLPARTTATGVAYSCTITNGTFTISNAAGPILIFSIKVTFTEAVTVDAGSQISTDGSQFRLIGTVTERTSTSYLDITSAGFEITYNSVTKTAECTMIYDNLTAITGGLAATTYDGTVYAFAYTLTSVPVDTTITVRAFVVVAGVTVYSSSGTVSNVS